MSKNLFENKLSKSLNNILNENDEKEFNYDINDGVAFENDSFKAVGKNGVFDVFFRGRLISSGLDHNDADLLSNSDVVIDDSGVIFNAGIMPHSDKLEISFINGPVELFKATNNIEKVQIPGYMASREDVTEYLPGGSRSGHYGGKNLIRAIINKVNKLSKIEQIDSANFGFMIILPGTPCVINFGQNDGVLVLQPVEIEIIDLKNKTKAKACKVCGYFDTKHKVCPNCGRTK